MNKTRFVLILACVLLFLAMLIMAPGRSLAGPLENGYTLDWWTVDGGGGLLVGSAYTLAGTVGQAEAGSPLKNSAYSLESGFWPARGPSNEQWIYLPMVTR